MRFVWLDVPGGGEIPVNPDQVAYLRAGQAAHEGLTEVVFGAVTGGLHSVIVEGDGRDVAAQLEFRELAPPDSGPRYSTWRPPPLPEPPARPKSGKRHTSKA